MRTLIITGILAALLAAPALAFLYEDTLLVDESRNYTTPAGFHEVRLVTVSEIERGAVFAVNGEYSESLSEQEDFLFKDGSHLRVDKILFGKRSYVEFSFNPGKGIPVPTVAGRAGSADENVTQPVCALDADCGDGDPCTKDSCAGEPALCVHASIPDCSAMMEQPRTRVPAAEPEGPFTGFIKWLAGLFRKIFG